MRFLADENCDYRVVSALRSAGHDAVATVEQDRGAADQQVFARALLRLRLQPDERRRVALGELRGRADGQVRQLGDRRQHLQPDPLNTAQIGKQIVVLVLRGVPQGREPKAVAPSAYDDIVLPTNNATMDD